MTNYHKANGEKNFGGSDGNASVVSLFYKYWWRKLDAKFTIHTHNMLCIVLECLCVPYHLTKRDGLMNLANQGKTAEAKFVDINKHTILVHYKHLNLWS